MPFKTVPYYPNKKVSYGNLYFFLKAKCYSLNPFDKEAILIAKKEMLKEARQEAPSYREFIKASTLATGLSETAIGNILKSNSGKLE